MMKLWLCRWPNGQVSLIRAKSAQHALELLDEAGPADPAWISELPTSTSFFVTFTPTGEPEAASLFPTERSAYDWHADEYSDALEDILGDRATARATFEAEQTALRRERLAALVRPCPTCGTTFPKTD